MVDNTINNTESLLSVIDSSQEVQDAKGGLQLDPQLLLQAQDFINAAIVAAEDGVIDDIEEAEIDSGLDALPEDVKQAAIETIDTIINVIERSQDPDITPEQKQAMVTLGDIISGAGSALSAAADGS